MVCLYPEPFSIVSPFIFHSSSIHLPFTFHYGMEDEWRKDGVAMDSEWKYRKGTKGVKAKYRGGMW
jgi:hypothetical protein